MTKLPWKWFDDVAAKEQICIVNYPDDVIPPGPNFDVKKLSATELQLLVGPYIATIQEEKDITGTMFRVKKMVPRYVFGTSYYFSFLTLLCSRH